MRRFSWLTCVVKLGIVNGDGGLIGETLQQAGIIGGKAALSRSGR